MSPADGAVVPVVGFVVTAQISAVGTFREPPSFAVSPFQFANPLALRHVLMVRFQKPARILDGAEHPEAGVADSALIDREVRTFVFQFELAERIGAQFHMPSSVKVMVSDGCNLAHARRPAR